MPTAYTTLTLTGGAATRNLVDGVNYSLERGGWSPAVPSRRRSRLAGSGPYDDADEQISVTVLGVDGPTAHGNLLALADDMDQATRWRNGEEINPILLNMQPQGSDLAAPLSVPVWGGDVPLGLPVTYNDQLMLYEIGPVTLRFKRPGLLFGPEETPAATAAATHPSVFSVSFATDRRTRLLPLTLQFDGFQGSQVASLDVGSDVYLMIADSDNKIKKVEAEAATAAAPGSGTFNTATDANASGGSIRRLVPVSAGDYTLLAGISPVFTAAKGLYTCVATVRNLSTTINYTARVAWYYGGMERASIRYSSPIVIDTSTTLPRTIVFEPVAWDNIAAPNNVRLIFTPSATAASGNQLDVDVFLPMQMTSPADRIIDLRGINKLITISAVLRLENLVLERPLPRVRNFSTGNLSYVVSHRGDIYLLTTGQTVAAAMVGTTNSHWRIVNGTIGSSPIVVSSTMTATRRLAYRVPQ
ncbi:MAG: hypothetical protein IAE79_28270 [Anaerolinea sp.]|nr:hypothetical protein [Anaerolinea sp.]